MERYSFFFSIIVLGMVLSFFLDSNGSFVRFNSGAILLGMVFASAIIEFSLRKFIPRYYFKYGIPILRREFSLFAIKNNITSLEATPEILKSNKLTPQIEIKYLNEMEYGLWANAVQSRDRLFRKRMANYNPITRGYLAVCRREKISNKREQC